MLRSGTDADPLLYVVNFDDNPVFIASVSGIVSGHAWVIDGYIDRERTITRENGAGIVIDTHIEHQKLMHCNWGWHAKGNGYYTSGMFETKSPILTDPTFGDKGNGYGTDVFKRHFYIITYNHPD